MQEWLSLFHPILKEPASDEDAVADLEKGVGGDPRSGSVLAPAEGRAQDGRHPANNAVEGQARDRWVDPLDLRVQVTGQRLFVTYF